MVSEWRHVVDRFNDFSIALKPIHDETDSARAAATKVARFLSDNLFGFPPDLRETVRDYRVIGGIAKGTAIAPAPGIDILFLLPEQLRADAGPELFQNIVGALARQFPIRRVTPEGWVTVETTTTPWRAGNQTPIAVKVVPCFPCGVDGYLVWDATENRGWRQLRPDAEAAALADADSRAKNKATELIMMLKAWRHANAVPLSGFAIELLVCDFIKIWTYHRRSLLFYDWMLRDFFFWLRHQDGGALRVPGSIETVEVGRDWRRHARDAHEITLRACEDERDNRTEQAVEAWRSLFGEVFPISRVALGPPDPNPLARAS